MDQAAGVGPASPDVVVRALPLSYTCMAPGLRPAPKEKGERKERVRRFPALGLEVGFEPAARCLQGSRSSG